MRWIAFSVIGVLLWAQRWQIQLPERVQDVFILDDGHLLVSTQKAITTFDRETGQVRWRCEACKQLFIEGWRPISEALPYLYESSSLPLLPHPRSQQSSFSSPLNYGILNAQNGRLILESRSGKWQGFAVRLVDTSTKTLIVLGNAPTDPAKKIASVIPIVAGYDIETGAPRFKQAAVLKASQEFLVPLAAAVYKGRAYYLSTLALYALDVSSGQTLWRRDLYRGFWDAVWHAGSFERLFIDPEADRLYVFAGRQLMAYEASSGNPVWAQSLRVPRLNILGFFHFREGLLLVTDDLTGSEGQPSPPGRNAVANALVILVDPATGQPKWEKKVTVPGLLIGYYPADEARLLLLFGRRRLSLIRGQNWTPDKDWEVVINLLDLSRGSWSFQKPYVLKGHLLNAARVPGGFLIQTTQAIQYLSEEGEALWERRLKRAMSLPFAFDGSEQAFLIDETGQVYRWKAASGNMTEKFGAPLKAFAGRDEPQGLLWRNNRLHVWGTSSLYILDREGNLVAEFTREVPGFSGPIRILGLFLSVTAEGAREALASRITWLRAPQDELPLVIRLRQSIQDNPLYAPMLQEAKKLGDLLYLIGKEGDQIKVYGVRLSDASLAFERVLGRPSLTSMQEIEVDPKHERIYLVTEQGIEAY